MDVHDRFVAVLNRLARATSIRRARQESAERFERNGGSEADLNAKLAEALPELERIAQRLERSAGA